MTVSDYDDPVQHDNPDVEEISAPEAPTDQQPAIGLIVWAIASLVVLGYLVFGVTKIYYWAPTQAFEDGGLSVRYEKTSRTENIFHIWTYQIEHIPSIGSELLVQILFLGSVAVFVAAVITGLWLLLNSPEPSSDLTTEPVDAT